MRLGQLGQVMPLNSLPAAEISLDVLGRAHKRHVGLFGRALNQQGLFGFSPGNLTGSAMPTVVKTTSLSPPAGSAPYPDSIKFLRVKLGRLFQSLFYAAIVLKVHLNHSMRASAPANLRCG